jgi:DNA processing protein
VLVPWGSSGYPPSLAELSDAPPVLALRGDPAALSEPAVAIVGSRAASAYGLEVASRVARELAQAGLVIVSGLAFGIDAAAHEAALASGGRTIAVQACGLDRVYPAAHRALAERIARSGAVVTEFAPGVPPLRAFFPLRNRLISGLARALVVVEARERSGSLVTARHAADQGVDVFAVPGPITSPHHVGSNRLLRDGAAPLLDSADVLAAIAWPGAPKSTGARLAITESARALLAVLRSEPASSDELARRLCAEPAALAPPLLDLELAGAIARDRDGRWRALV